MYLQSMDLVRSNGGFGSCLGKEGSPLCLADITRFVQTQQSPTVQSGPKTGAHW